MKLQLGSSPLWGLVTLGEKSPTLEETSTTLVLCLEKFASLQICQCYNRICMACASFSYVAGRQSEENTCLSGGGAASW